MAHSTRKNRVPDNQTFVHPLDETLLGGSAEATDFASRRLLAPLAPSYDPLSEIEDRRTYHPLGSDRPALYSVAPLQVKDRQPSPRQRQAGFRPNSQTKGVIAFAQPDQVVLCVRRKERREVLFAKKKTRRGPGGPRRRNWTTFISCR